MPPELHFPHVILTRPWSPPLCPREIATVEQAIDAVQELPPVVLKLGRWQPVFSALWDALDAPLDLAKLDAAHAGLCAALAAEGWLDDGPLA